MSCEAFSTTRASASTSTGWRWRAGSCGAMLSLALIFVGGSSYLLKAADAPNIQKAKETPLAPEIEKALADYADRSAPAKAAQFQKQITKVVEAIDSKVHLTAEERASLDEASQKAVTEAVKIWQPQLVKEMRLDVKTTDVNTAVARIARWRAEPTAIYRFVDKAPPAEQMSSWNAALKASLGAERFALWDEEVKKAKAQRAREVREYVTAEADKEGSALERDMTSHIDLLAQEVHISPEQVKALQAAMKKVVDAVKQREIPITSAMLETTADEVWNSTYQLHRGRLKMDVPALAKDLPEWGEEVRKVVSAEQIAAAQKVKADREQKLIEEIKKGLSGLEGDYQNMYQTSLRSESDSVASALEFTPERAKALHVIEDAVVNRYVAEWRKKMAETLSHMSEDQRKSIFDRHMGIGVEMEGNGDIRQSTDWKKNLEAFLTPEEMKRWKTTVENRANALTNHFARVALMEMDRRVRLSSEQREKLQPLAMKRISEMLKEQGIRLEQEFNIDTSQMIHVLANAKSEEVRPFLDEKQWIRWQDGRNAKSSYQSFETPQGQGSKKKPASASSAKPGGKRPEPPNADVIISEHLRNRCNSLAASEVQIMESQVEEAIRVGSLSPEAGRHLMTAAKGSVELMMKPWRTSMDSWVRNQLRDATAQNVRPRLEGMGMISFRQTTDPKDLSLWKKTLEEVMPADRLKVWQKEQDARAAYYADTVTDLVLFQTQRRCPLNDEQTKKLKPLLKKVIDEYGPDIQNWISSPWYLSSYYCTIPLAGIPQKELEKILGAERLKQAEGTVLSMGAQYWEGIKSQHDIRMRNVDAGGITISF